MFWYSYWLCFDIHIGFVLIFIFSLFWYSYCLCFDIHIGFVLIFILSLFWYSYCLCFNIHIFFVYYSYHLYFNVHITAYFFCIIIIYTLSLYIQTIVSLYFGFVFCSPRIWYPSAIRKMNVMMLQNGTMILIYDTRTVFHSSKLYDALEPIFRQSKRHHFQMRIFFKAVP